MVSNLYTNSIPNKFIKVNIYFIIFSGYKKSPEESRLYDDNFFEVFYIEIELLIFIVDCLLLGTLLISIEPLVLNRF